MKQLFYGQIDLTKLGNIVRQHSELVKEVEFKDGKHKLLNLSILDKEQEDKYGNTACLKVSCKREEEKKMINYFLGDLKLSEHREKPAPKTESWDEPINKDDLPF